MSLRLAPQVHTQRGFFVLCLLLGLGILSLGALNLSTGYSKISLHEILFSDAISTIANLRISRVAVMALCGLAIPTSGFLLQEYFQNPLAGPSVLGITSVASLSVALFIFLSAEWNIPIFLHNSLLSTFAIVGSILLMLLLLVVSSRFKDRSTLVIFGFLISALCGAVVSLLQFYAQSESLKNYILWSFGSTAQVTSGQIRILAVLVLVGLLLAAFAVRPLIGGLLGVQYASSIGVNLSSLKIFVIVSSSLLAASITAYLGPILFIGIIVPHFSRMVWNPAMLWHQWILNMLLGILIMQLFSAISESSQLPLNVITSLFGIPVIFTMFLKKNQRI